MTPRDLLAAAVPRLSGEEARREAELLLLHVLGRPCAWLYAHGDEPLGAAAIADYDALIARRARGEPVAHLTGRREFWSLDLGVDAHTLIPRPETELLVELALQRIPQDADVDIADLGTGSGAIALAIAYERPHARVVATDASVGALAQARSNAQRLGLRVEFLEGDWCAALGMRTFQVIASNPPYIRRDDPHLEQGDLRFEPLTALASGADGLDAIRAIAAQAPQHLYPGGWLLFEHGWDQGDAVRRILAEAGFSAVFTAPDLEGRDRVSGGRKAG